jgi:hypothetical protein
LSGLIDNQASPLRRGGRSICWRSKCLLRVPTTVEVLDATETGFSIYADLFEHYLGDAVAEAA